jgi:hypothetical protein
LSKTSQGHSSISVTFWPFEMYAVNGDWKDKIKF